MPYKRKPYTGPRRRRYTARRRYPARTRSSASRGKGYSAHYRTKPAPVVFPPTKHVMFTYTDSKALSVAPGARTTSAWRANAISDPDVDIGGGQPRYFDTLIGANDTAAPYYSWLVKSCRATVYARNISITRFMFVSLTICPDTTTAPLDLEEARSRSDTVVRCIAPIGSGNAQCKLTMTRWMSTLFNVTDVKDLSTLRSNLNNLPTLGARVHVNAYNPDDTVNTQGVNYDIRLVYNTELMRQNDVSDS